MEAEITFKLDKSFVKALDTFEDFFDVNVKKQYIPALAEYGLDVIEHYAPEQTGNLKRNLVALPSGNTIDWESVALDSKGIDYAPIQEYGGYSTNIPDFEFAPKRYMEGASIVIESHFENAMQEAVAYIRDTGKAPALKEVWDFRYPEQNPITRLDADLENRIDSAGNQYTHTGDLA